MVPACERWPGAGPVGTGPASPVPGQRRTVASPDEASQATDGGPGIGMTRGSAPMAALTSAAQPSRVEALTASVKYTPPQPEPSSSSAGSGWAGSRSVLSRLYQASQTRCTLNAAAA